MKFFQKPSTGDIVWCLFPESLRKPGPKPRPALVIEVGKDHKHDVIVTVIYGTTKKLDRLYPSEFKIEKRDGRSFMLSGLAADTKFDFHHRIKLPFCSTWFGKAPGQFSANEPRLGVLAPNLVARARKAFDQVT
jgi:mRNA-degrading endonuclease toxin of MazEF toxin-antitoxin module